MDKNLLKTLKDEHSTLQKKINSLKAEMQEKSKELMKEAFRNFFEKYSDVVENIFWTQYTPFFNDGEPCEFSVHDAFLTLKGDEDACEYEGSTLYSKENVKELESKIKDFVEWEKDPIGAAQAYRSKYITRYNKDPFEDRYSYMGMKKSPEKMMAEWTPHYGSKKDYERELSFAKKSVENYPNLKKDFGEIKSMISDIEEDLMKAMFDDHAKVIVTPKGIEVEEFAHD